MLRWTVAARRAKQGVRRVRGVGLRLSQGAFDRLRTSLFVAEPHTDHRDLTDVVSNLLPAMVGLPEE